jgi:2-oxoglutarate ferredoxin oxidoreductase subunit beta
MPSSLQSAAEKSCHKAEPFLRAERMPHIWCPGCGIGVTVNSFVAAVEKCRIPLEKLAVVSGIGCTGRVAGYIRLDSIHVTHGRAIPFATGLKLANPELKVVVYSGDGDLISIGGNHFIHAAHRNVDLTVICVNNLNYAMTGGQVAPTTPAGARAATAPYGAYERSFNLPHLAEACGASYVARWTSLHVRNLTHAIAEALNRKGFRFIEIIAPCPTLYARLNKLGDGLDETRFYQKNYEIRNGADTRLADLSLRGKIIVGKFVDRERPTYLEEINAYYERTLGDRYVWWGPKNDES